MTATTELEPGVRSDPGHAPPCEHSQHSKHHVPPDEPAKYYVLVQCHGCNEESRYNLCAPGLERMTQPGYLLYCAKCGSADPWEDCLWILDVLR